MAYNYARHPKLKIALMDVAQRVNDEDPDQVIHEVIEWLSNEGIIVAGPLEEDRYPDPMGPRDVMSTSIVVGNCIFDEKRLTYPSYSNTQEGAKIIRNERRRVRDSMFRKIAETVYPLPDDDQSA
jgi:hypothetical protein